MSKTMRGLVLLSGGFDSPVAAKLVQQQGVELIAVHFSQEKFAGKEAIEKTKKLCALLGIRQLIVLDISDVLKQFVEKADRHYYFVFMKRLFFKLAAKIAAENNCAFLVTGENLGQVSSQTLSNLSTVARATQLPVLRPLLGMEKQAIISLSKQFGFHDTSVGKELCDFLGPEKPATVSTIERLEQEENKIDWNAVLATILENKTFLEIQK